MTRHLHSLARWTRRHGFKVAQLALLAWIAVELHGLNDQASAGLDPADVAEIADRLDDVVDAMQPPGARAGVETVALRHRSAGHHAPRPSAVVGPRS
ncbi:MAG: hypothetical protein ACXWC2_03440 [Ramlibacter sp.]